MNLSELKTKAKLIELVIEDEDTIKEYGDKIVLYMNDSIDLQTYFDFYKYKKNDTLNDLVGVLRKIVRDEKGNLMFADDEMMPVLLISRIVGVIDEQLGKSATHKSTLKETGTAVTS
jgi:hypothetical protein